MQIIPLSPEEKQKLRNENVTGTIIAGIAFPVIGGFAFLILSTLDRDMFFIAYIVGFVFLLVFGMVAYQFYRSWQDLKVGTKNVSESKILDKKHEITHSSSGTGNNRTTTTNHYYSFVLENEETLRVSEQQYQQFRQGQLIQIEKLTYSKTLWDLRLLKDSAEVLPTTETKTETKPLPASFITPLQDYEITYLRQKLNAKITWSLVYVLPYAFLFYLMVMVVNILLGFFHHNPDAWLYTAVIAIALTGALTWRNIKKTQDNFEADLQGGKEMTCLRLKDKEIIKSGGTICILYLGSTRLPVQSDLYQQIEGNQRYWVGKTVGSKQTISLHTEDQLQSWDLR